MSGEIVEHITRGQRFISASTRITNTVNQRSREFINIAPNSGRSLALVARVNSYEQP